MSKNNKRDGAVLEQKEQKKINCPVQSTLNLFSAHISKQAPQSPWALFHSVYSPEDALKSELQPPLTATLWGQCCDSTARPWNWNLLLLKRTQPGSSVRKLKCYLPRECQRACRLILKTSFYCVLLYCSFEFDGCMFLVNTKTDK